MASKYLSEKDDVAQTKPIKLRILLRIFVSMRLWLIPVIIANFFLFICLWSDIQLIVEIGKILDNVDLKTVSIMAIMTYFFAYAFMNRLFGMSQFATTILSTNQALANLRKEFFSVLSSLSKRFFDQHKVGWLMARATGDMGSLSEFMTFALMMIMISGGIICVALYKISSIQIYLLLPCLLAMPFTFICTIIFKRKMTKIQRELREENSRMIGYLAESIRGIKVTQAYSREKLNTEKFEKLNLINYEKGIHASKINGIYMPTMEVLGALTIAGAMYYGLELLNKTEGATLTAGNLVTYLLLINTILFPVRMLVELYSLSISAMASAERIFELIDLKPDIMNKEKTVPFPKEINEISFEHVSFQYKENSPKVLDDFSFKTKPKETIAIVGETGAGKSTIISLLARFYDVENGSIEINGTNIKDYDQHEMRKAMGIVLQDGFLFSGTIMQNLKFRNSELTDQEVITFAKKLGTHFAFEHLPNKYNTLVGEGGHAISHGQRQLISLTRALISEPEILIFDEATSSIDVLTESILIETIEKISENTTSIIIAHRLSTIKKADRIIVLEKGKIAEEGNYQELINKNGLFSILSNEIEN